MSLAAIFPDITDEVLRSPNVAIIWICVAFVVAGIGIFFLLVKSSLKQYAQMNERTTEMFKAMLAESQANREMHTSEQAAERNKHERIVEKMSRSQRRAIDRQCSAFEDAIQRLTTVQIIPRLEQNP